MSKFDDNLFGLSRMPVREIAGPNEQVQCAECNTRLEKDAYLGANDEYYCEACADVVCKRLQTEYEEYARKNRTNTAPLPEYDWEDESEMRDYNEKRIRELDRIIAEDDDTVYRFLIPMQENETLEEAVRRFCMHCDEDDRGLDQFPHSEDN